MFLATQNKMLEPKFKIWFLAFKKTHTIHVWYVSCTGVFGAIGIILSLSDDSNMLVGQYVKGLVMTQDHGRPSRNVTGLLGCCHA